MFDTMTSTKVVGSLCMALLVFLLGKWAAEEIYHLDSQNPGVVELTAMQFIEVPEADVPEEDFSELLAMADASKGAKVFNKCKACHKLADGENSVGPHLFQIVDRQIGAVSGFAYSNPMSSLEGVWNVDELNAFLNNPRQYLPGTKMTFAGLKKGQDRADVIAYMQSEPQ